MTSSLSEEGVRRDRPAGLGPGGATRERCRSFCFLEREHDRWTAFLVTYPGAEGGWRGYFAFRPATAGPQTPEIRTADLFVEDSEAEIDARARGLGRPLLVALLDSALDTYERRQGVSPDARRWFRGLLARGAAERAVHFGVPVAELSLSHLRSLYASYRLDQVAHLISLVEPDDFRALVERLLDGRAIDFRSRDRFQLAMIVVQELERRLPLPPFEAWVEDYVAHRAAYQLYSRELHRGEALP